MTLAWSTLFSLLLLSCLPSHPCLAQFANSAGDAGNSWFSHPGAKGVVFEANQGQLAGQTKFLGRGHREKFHFMANSVVFVVDNGANSLVFRMTFLGGRSDARIRGAERCGETSYFTGKTEERWNRRVPQFRRLIYEGVYPGIDVAFYSNSGLLEYDLLVAPKADVSQVQLRFDGLGPLMIDDAGRVRAQSAEAGVSVLQHLPATTQIIRGKSRNVMSRFRLVGDRTVAIGVDPYDRTEQLVVDPVFSFSTFLGGSDNDSGLAVATDRYGNVYVTGQTTSRDLPTTLGVIQRRTGGGTCRDSGGSEPGQKDQVLPCPDIFVTKISPDGKEVLYSTYIGGTGLDAGNAISVDSTGNAYVAGVTNSLDFPVTSGAAQEKLGGQFDGFVLKLSASGSELLYSTYLGGRGADLANGIASDGSGGAVVVGNTTSLGVSSFPVSRDALQSQGGSFVAKFAGDGRLVYSTCLGTLSTAIKGVALDKRGNIYVAGVTLDGVFPTTPGSFQGKPGVWYDAFVTKFNSTGTKLEYSTFLGGNGDDKALAIAVDAQGQAHVTGLTNSSDFPTTPGVLLRSYRSPSGFRYVAPTAFVTKFSADGAGIKYSTYLRDDPSTVKPADLTGDVGQGIAVDSAGNAIVVGVTASLRFPTTRDALQPANKSDPARTGKDAFVCVLNDTGSALNYSTYLGGGGSDKAYGVALDESGGVIVAGATASTDFVVTSSAIQSTYLGGVDGVPSAQGVGGGRTPFSYLGEGDAFVAKLQSAGPSVTAVVNAASYLAAPIAPGEIVTVFGSALSGATLVPLRVTPAGLLDNSLAGTRVLFDGVPAPLLYVSATQISCVVPYGIDGRDTTELQVEYQGVASSKVKTAVSASSPGVFTFNSSGKGPVAALNQDGTMNTQENPAERGSIVTMFLTGEGQTTPRGIDGKPAKSEYPKPNGAVTATIDGRTAEVIYAGAAPGLVAGVMQLNLRVPVEVGAVPTAGVEVRIGNRPSQPGVTIALR